MHLTRRATYVEQFCAYKCCFDLSKKYCNERFYASLISNNEKWNLLSGVCLERKPLLTKPMAPIETKFSQTLEQIEFERSLKSDHEVRHELDRRQAELLKKGEVPELDEEKTTQTAQDFEDLCQEELSNFKFSPKVCGNESDVHSTKRKLDSSLLLLVKQKLGDGVVWSLPQGLRNEGEAMHQTAERVLKEACGSDLKVRFYGFAPCGFYKYKYPLKARLHESDTVGAKVFFFKAELLSGSVQCNGTSVEDFRWLGRDELATDLQREYYRSVMSFLIDE